MTDRTTHLVHQEWVVKMVLLDRAEMLVLTILHGLNFGGSCDEGRREDEDQLSTALTNNNSDR